MILLWPFDGKKTLKTFMAHPSRGFKPQKKAKAQKAPEASPGRNVRPSVGLVARTRGVHFIIRVHTLYYTGCALCRTYSGWVHGMCTLSYLHRLCVHFVVRTRGVHFIMYTGCALFCSYTGCAFSSYVRIVCTFVVHTRGGGERFFSVPQVCIM